MNDEGLADVAAANPFRLPRLHRGIGLSVASVPDDQALALEMFDKHDGR